MENRIKDKLKKDDILTIPNLLSFFRILLIPVIVVCYTYYNNHMATVIVIAISAITDVLDGKIARKFNMISDFGKFIDPVADKLTQLFMIICLVIKYPKMLGLIFLMFIKESFLFIMSYITFKKTGIVNSSKWYGKLTTFTLYAAMVVFFLFPRLSPVLADALITICYIVIFGSLMLYTRMFSLTLKNAKKNTHQNANA
jgi:cardiolipin synthase